MAEKAGFEKPILVAAPIGTAEKLGEILAGAGYPLSMLCTSGAQAAEAGREQQPAVLVATHRLSDMTGEKLISQMAGAACAILILPQGEEPETELPESTVVMHNPLNKDIFLQTVHVLMRMSSRIEQLSREAARLERLLAARKLIDRAKARLMEERNMSESEAHHCMQKLSMDSGKRLADVARGILEEQKTV